MKRKGVAILVCVIAVIIVSIAIYIFAGTTKAKNLMWEYLDNKGYARTAIEEVDVNHSFLNIFLSYNEWNIEVIYTDEPTSI